jgi:malate dehydrogenase (oxaloacetate-decarboxylating)
VLSEPLINRGTAFTHAQRETLGLTGLLPPAVDTLDVQATRAWQQIERKKDAVEKYIGVDALASQNEVCVLVCVCVCCVCVCVCVCECGCECE